MPNAPMTPEQLETLRLKMRVLAQEVTLEWLTPLFAALLTTLPPDAQSRSRTAMKQKIDSARKKYSTLTIDQLHAAESDLHTAEFQDAIDVEMQKIEKALGI